MKRSLHFFIPLLLAVVALASCSTSVDVMKRRYNKGFYINGSGEPRAQHAPVKGTLIANNRQEASVIAAEEQATGDVSQHTEPALTAAPIAAPLAVNAAPADHAEKAIGKKILLGQAKKLKKAEPGKNSSDPGGDQLIALALCLLAGVIGIHRFYLGYYGIGIIQLLTLGACGIWTLIDLIMIITGTLKPKGGEYKKTMDDHF